MRAPEGPYGFSVIGLHSQVLSKVADEASVLREDRKAAFKRELLGLAWRFASGSTQAKSPISLKAYEEAREQQKFSPVPVGQDGRTRWWWFSDRFYRDEDDLEPQDVMALAYEMITARERKIENARARMLQGANGNATQRGHLSRDAKLRIWERDNGRCRNCGSDRLLQFDHVVPLALGGSNQEGNFQLLCDACNQAKGGNLGEPEPGGPSESRHGLAEEIAKLKAAFYDGVKSEREALVGSLDAGETDAAIYAGLIVATNLMKQELQIIEGWIDEAAAEVGKGTATGDQVAASRELIAWAEPELEALQVEFDALALARDQLARDLPRDQRSQAFDESQDRFEETKQRIIRPLSEKVEALQAEVAS